MHGASVRLWFESVGSVLIAELKVKVKVSICIWLISSMFFHQQILLLSEPNQSRCLRNMYRTFKNRTSLFRKGYEYTGRDLSKMCHYFNCLMKLNWSDEQISNEIGFIWAFLTRLSSTVQSHKWIHLTFTTHLICQIKLYRILKQGSMNYWCPVLAARSRGYLSSTQDRQ